MSCPLQLWGIPITLAMQDDVNGINGKGFTTVEVDVTGKPVSNGSSGIGLLESKFYKLIFVP